MVVLVAAGWEAADRGLGEVGMALELTVGAAMAAAAMVAVAMAEVAMAEAVKAAATAAEVTAVEEMAGSRRWAV